MKNKLNAAFLIAGLLLSGLSFGTGHSFTWMQKSPIPGIASGVYSGCSFTINNLIYVAGGCTSGLDSNYQNLWEYDPSSDVWTQRADMPVGGTYGSSAFTINNVGYVFTGWHRTGPSSTVAISFNYKYDPSINAWDSVAAFPNLRYTAVAFELNGKGYLGTGYAPLSNDWWEYDATADSWTQKANLPGNARQAGNGFSLGGYGYVCMGGYFQQNNSDMWQYDATANSWLQKANYPDTARSSASTFVLDGKAYLMGGSNWGGDPFASIYCYDPALDQWTFVCYFPGGKRHAMITAVANNKVYMGQGSYTDQNAGTYLTANDWWECTLVDANVVSGKAFLDFNNNQTEDVGEPPVAGKFVKENTTGRFTFTRLNGTYDLAITDSGSFDVSMDTLSYFSPNPLNHLVNFTSTNQTDSFNDFAFQAANQFNDLAVSISPLGAFRPGFDASYEITYSNIGTTVISNPVLYFVLDTNVSYISSSETPLSTGADTISWSLPSLSPFQNGSLTVTVNVNQTTPIGTMVYNPVILEPTLGDINQYNNYDFWNVEVTGSFDPNDIAVSEESLLTTQFPNPPYLDYVIRFQNTGNDTAFNIDVVNALSTYLDISSFELVSSSHPVEVRYIDGYNSLGFKFNNILLVDSNMNEAMSHGYIHYRIKPVSNLVLGDQIPNSAGIYFDFNAPVLTNTAITTVVSPTAVKNVVKSTASVIAYPNPANDMLNVLVNAASPSESKIYLTDIAGRKVMIKESALTQGKNKVELNTTKLNAGAYFLTVEYGTKKDVIKVLIK